MIVYIWWKCGRLSGSYSQHLSISAYTSSGHPSGAGMRYPTNKLVVSINLSETNRLLGLFWDGRNIVYPKWLPLNQEGDY